MLDISVVKDLFPLWTEYCDNTDATLQREMDRASEFMQEYIPGLNSDNITDPLKLHYMNIVRKRCFDLKLGDREFEHKPPILRDFEYTLEQLEKYRTDQIAGPTIDTSEKTITMSAKDRRFDTWFL